MEPPVREYAESDPRPSLRPLAPVLLLLGGAWLSAAAMIFIRLA
jgi:hypothetical protein